MKKNKEKIMKTFLDEGDIICDICGRLAKKDEVIEVRDPTSTIVLHQHKERCKDAGKQSIRR